MGLRLHLKGKRFGRLLVLRDIGLTKDKKVRWECICDCGNKTTSISYLLSSGHTKSCGCYRADHNIKTWTKHGHSKSGNHSVEFSTWQNIKSRCHNPKNSHFRYYGGRGISVCKRWLNSFENFYTDMGKRPDNKHSIERINVNKGYSPSNCKWILSKHQAKNKTNNHWIEHDGRRMIQEDWAKELQCSSWDIHKLLKNGYNMSEVIKIIKNDKKTTRNINRGI